MHSGAQVATLSHLTQTAVRLPHQAKPSPTVPPTAHFPLPQEQVMFLQVGILPQAAELISQAPPP